MAQDATGTPTAKGIPKYNTATDAPSGKGFNAAMDVIDGLVSWVKARKNSTGSVFERARLNFIEGSGITLTVADDAVDNEIDITITAAGSTMPPGAITEYGGSSAPADWLLCDGTAVSRTTYSALFAIIGTDHGVGDGSTTFNLPDFRGRMPVGKGSNAAVNVLGENEGVTEANRRPQHRHTAHSHTAPYALVDSGGANAAVVAGDASTPVFSTPTSSVDGGSGVATDSLNAPAYLVINYIIKT